MRKIGWKRAFCDMIAVAGSISCALSALALDALPCFPRGEEYAFYAVASSSARRETSEAPFAYKLTELTAGESVRYSGQRYAEIAERFDAKLLFTETVGGVTNYYLYSPFLGDGIALNGVCVNLHVAAGREETVVGTPIIFGGD